MNTKKIICDSYASILKAHRAEDITVQMVLDHAQVSRSTFYRHFRDLYDLMTWYYKDHLDRLQGLSDISNYETNLASSFAFLQENKSYFKKILKASEETALFKFIVQHAIEYYKMIYTQLLGKPVLSPRERTQINVISHGAAAVVRDWILSDCDMTATELAKYIAEMVPPEMRSLVSVQPELPV